MPAWYRGFHNLKIRIPYDKDNQILTGVNYMLGVSYSFK